MKLGLEDKRKVYSLGALFALLGYFFYANVLSNSTPSSAPAQPSSARAVSAAPPPPSIAPAGTDTPPRASAPRASSRNRGDEFIPVLHSKRPEDQIDPNSVDPTLKLGLLAKLQTVDAAGSGRNLFVMGAPPVQKPAGPEPKVAVGHGYQGPTEIPPPPPVLPPPPEPLPAITFKYYGFSTVRRDGKKTAFFLIGDQVTIRAVGEMVDHSYRLLTIGLTTAVVEDTRSKRTQTVQLAEEAQS